MPKMSKDEQALETARAAFHKNRKSAEAREAFKDAQRAVQADRTEKRRQREAEGPPPDVNVKRDVDSRVMGWESPEGDAVAAPGGMEG